MRASLPDCRLPLDHGPARRRQLEVPARIDGQTVHAFKRDPDLIRISAGAHDKVVLETHLVAMEHGIDPRINGGISYARVSRDAADPVGLFADQVTGNPG